MSYSGSMDYVKVASFLFLKKYEDDIGDQPPGLTYNKFMIQLNTDLKDRGRDIKLPHCWYRCGDEVVRCCLPYVDWNHNEPDAAKVCFEGNDPKYDSCDPLVCMISKFADRFIDDCRGREGAEIAKDKVYEKAPFDFQREYKKLRENLQLSTKKEAPVIGNQHEYIHSLFENAMKVFPKEFNQVNEQKQYFEAVFKMALNSGASLRDMYDLVEYFWFLFCYHLRLNKKCHDNVPKSTLMVWDEKSHVEKDRFDHIIQNYAHMLYSRDHADETVNRLAEEWESRARSIDELLSELGD